MPALVMQLGLVVPPGCRQEGVGRSQEASAEVVEMALLRRKVKRTPYQEVEASVSACYLISHITEDPTDHTCRQ